MTSMNPHRQVVVQKRGANHTLHIVLTICTFGLWLPIWAIASAKGRKTKTVTYAPQQQPLPYQPTNYIPGPPAPYGRPVHAPQQPYQPGRYYPPQ